MCHLLLLMPVLALPILWLMPLSFAIPIYVVIALISGLLYRLVWKSMRKPMETGVQSLIGAEATVVARLSPGYRAQYLVRSGGEMWSARCTDVLQPGETVKITALDRINLVIELRNKSSHPGQSSDVESKQPGAKTSERHCH